VQDLSSLAENGPWVTSQAGGNMMSSNEQAMTGKGTDPADPLPDRENQGDPKVGVTDTLQLNYPPGRITGSTYRPAPVAWKTTETQ
jgi:hypothetical protein